MACILVDRSTRRHYAERAKKRVAKAMPWVRDDPAMIGVRARTRAICSCIFCGNPRKWFKKMTRQERVMRAIEKTLVEDAAIWQEISEL